MLSYDATQLAIVASDYKKISWLFTVVDFAGPTTYHWSIITRSYGGHNYVYKIDPKSFSGIKLNSTNPIYGVISPNDLSFTIENSGNTLVASNFIGGTVTIDLVISDGTNEEILRTCKFSIKRCEDVYQTLKFTCESILQKYVEKDYPNKRLVKDIIPSNDPDIDDGLCVPVPIGQCYVPLRSLYIVDQRYYLLGLASEGTYTISKVRSPRSWPHPKSEWDSGDYSFNQSTKTIDSVDWRVFQAIIADSDGDNIADANGLFPQGDSFLDMPTQFSKDNTGYISGDETGTHDGADNAAILTDTGASWGVDKLIGAYVINRTDGSYGKITDNDATTVTATLTGGTDNDWDIGDSYTIGGPASCIKFVLEDMGVPPSDIDDTSFAIAEKTFAGWGLTFNGVFDHKKPGAQVLAQLLVMCHSTFQFTDKIGLHVLSKTSQKTITSADVLRTSKAGPGTFKYSLVTQKQSDSGYIEFQVAGESQDKFIKKLVPAKASTDSISSEILTIPFVQDTQDVQRIGTLYYQRKFSPKANISFTNKGGTLLALQPDDVITINDTNYGGNYLAVIKSVFIKHDLSIDFQLVRYSVDLDDWTDLSPSVITIEQDDSTVTFNEAGNRVFSVPPYPPYDIGDLWVAGPEGDIKKCVTARASGAYQAGDWELASEYDNTSSVHQIFRVVSKGRSSISHPRDAALLDESGAVLKGGARSYNVSVFDRATHTWDSHTTYDVYDDSDTKNTLYSTEVSATGTTPVASQTFTPVDCTGLTKANGTLIIDLKCTDWTKMTSGGQIEVSSSTSVDTNEWNFGPGDLPITSEWKTFNIPLSVFGTSGGEVDVSDIKRIRWYSTFSESETIYWRNARIYFGDTDGPRAMADALYSLDSSKIVVIFSYDEPSDNRLESNLDTQIYSCGGSKIIYGSDNFKFRSAYCLIGIPGIGQGNGLELYSGDVDSDPDAWVDTTFTVESQGNIGLSSINVRDAVDISYQDGTVVEDLKPAEAGADITGGNTAANIAGQGDLATQDVVTASQVNTATLSAITADCGSVTAGTITGTLIRTAASGDRLEIDHNLLNRLKFYRGTVVVIGMSGNINDASIAGGSSDGVECISLNSTTTRSSMVVLLDSSSAASGEYHPVLSVKTGNINNHAIYAEADSANYDPLYIDQQGTGTFIHASNGAYLSNGGVWHDVSSVTLKENFEDFIALDLIKNLSIKRYNYIRERRRTWEEIRQHNLLRWKRRKYHKLYAATKHESQDISQDKLDAVILEFTELQKAEKQLPLLYEEELNRPVPEHISPMAEDFYASFGVGDDKSISAKDLASVSLQGVKELLLKVEQLETRIVELEQKG